MLLFLAWTNITSMCGLLIGIFAVVNNPEGVDERIAAFFMLASTAFTLSALGLSIGYLLRPL